MKVAASPQVCIGDARLPFSSLFPSKKPQSESSDSLCGFFDADKI